jgi:hypothetical protein
MGEPTDGSHMGKDDHTAALLEKLTQMITLQQTLILNLQQNTNSSLSIPTAESYIHPNPISVKLNGKNYFLWSQVVMMYVKGRDKLRHITGNPLPPQPEDAIYPKWDIDDTVVKGWLINSLESNLTDKFIRFPTTKEVWDALSTTFYDGSDAVQVFELNKRVARLKQLGRPVEEYYNDLQSLWQEIDFRRPNPMIHAEDIKKFNNFVQENRVCIFLDELDDRLDNERANILQLTPFPTVEQAFTRVRK